MRRTTLWQGRLIERICLECEKRGGISILFSTALLRLLGAHHARDAASLDTHFIVLSAFRLSIKLAICQPDFCFSFCKMKRKNGKLRVVRVWLLCLCTLFAPRKQVDLNKRETLDRCKSQEETELCVRLAKNHNQTLPAFFSYFPPFPSFPPFRSKRSPSGLLLRHAGQTLLPMPGCSPPKPLRQATGKRTEEV